MTETKQKTIWKTYPGIPFLQANQFGEIRTIDRYVETKRGTRFIKGRILKQQRNKHGYMFIGFGVNGKRVQLLVHRIVATCFIPNPDNLPEVNHKDNDRTNNSLDNLEWCTKKHNESYKKNFGTTSAQVLGHPVYAVDLKTDKVLRFKTQSEAARQLGVDQGSIAKAVKGQRNTVGGYWFTEDKSEITEEKIREIKAKMRFFGGVVAINLDTFKVFYFESQSEAARQLDIGQGNIGSVVRGELNKTKGFWFCRADENAVEKVRSKFGVEIANKVRELI